MIGGLNTNHNTYYRQQNQLSFKSGVVTRMLGGKTVTSFFESLKKKPVIEIAALDAGTMIIPRTLVDLKQNLVYGVETFFRELIPMFPNPFMPGIVGNMMMRAKGYKDLYANSATMKTLHKAWETAGGKFFDPKNPGKDIVKKYFTTILQNTDGLIGKELKRLDGNDIDNLADGLAKLTINKKNMSRKDFRKGLADISEQYTKITGASESLTVKIGKGLDTNANNLFRDSIAVADQILTKTIPGKIGGVIDDLSNYVKKAALLAVGSSIAVGASIQPIITSVSKLVTGKEGFTGYKESDTEIKAHAPTIEAEKPESKKDLTFEKSLATAGMAAIMLASLNPKSLFKNGGGIKGAAKKLVENLELKGPFAHMDIVRFVYGGILMGRFWAARDETELKVSVARDYAGFLNWLVLGGIVTKGVAHALDKDLVNISGPIKDKNMFKTASNWLSNVSVKSVAERKAMGKGLLNAAKHNGAMIAGLGYAMFALGIGVPMLINKYIINKPGKEENEDKNLYSAVLDKKSPSILFSKYAKKQNDQEDSLFGQFTAKMSS